MPKSVKDKAIILMLYMSGLRFSTLRALRAKDVIDEIKKGYEVVNIPVYPEMKEVDPGACKGNIPYFTFVGRKCVQMLKRLLEERVKEFGGLEGDEPSSIPQARTWTTLFEGGRR